MIKYCVSCSKNCTLSFQRNMDEAFRLSLKGCDLNKYESCANASVMLRKGEGTDKDPEKAAAVESG